MQVSQGAPMKGILTKESIALIVNLCEMAGKMQGVSSYKALGALLSELEGFEEVKSEQETDQNGDD